MTLTRREQFAMTAMHGFLTNEKSSANWSVTTNHKIGSRYAKNLAHECVEVADALIEELGKRKTYG